MQKARRGSRHDKQVTKADLAGGQDVNNLGQLSNVLADRYVAGSSRTGHVAVDANPVDRGGRAIFFVVIGGAELGGLPGEGELHQRDHVALGDEPLATNASVLTSRLDFVNVLRREHRNIVRTCVRQVKVWNRFICSLTTCC